YSPDGKLLKSWGEPGTDPGQFNIVHNVCCDADGWVYVADRENHRVQVFDGTANTRRSGTTCTGLAASTCRAASSRSAISASSAQTSRSTATSPISGRG